MDKILKIAFIKVADVTALNLDAPSCSLSCSAIAEPLDFISPASVGCTASHGSAGTLYSVTVSASLRFAPQGLAESLPGGILILFRTQSGKMWLAGCPDFPLSGTLVKNHQGKASDRNNYTLNLSGRQLHDMLEVSSFDVQGAPSSI